MGRRAWGEMSQSVGWPAWMRQIELLSCNCTCGLEVMWKASGMRRGIEIRISHGTGDMCTTPGQQEKRTFGGRDTYRWLCLITLKSKEWVGHGKVIIITPHVTIIFVTFVSGSAAWLIERATTRTGYSCHVCLLENIRSVCYIAYFNVGICR